MKNIIRALVYLLIGIFPLGLLLRIKLATNVYIIPQDLVVFLIFVCVIFFFFKEKRLPEFKNFYAFQMLFLIVGLLSLFINFYLYHDINLIPALLYAGRYISYLSILSIGYFFSESKKLKRFIALSSSAFIFLGFLQFIFFNDLRHIFYLGWDDHLYRLVSTVFDPNFAGIMYVVIFYLFLAKTIKNPFKTAYFDLIVALFAFFAIYLTYSRSALIALFAGLVLFLFNSKKIGFVIIGVAAFLIPLFIVSDTHIEGLNPFRTASSLERVKSIEESFQIFKRAPVLGVGFNGFRDAQLRYKTRYRIGSSKSNADAGTNSSLLFVVATTGIVGAIFYIFSIWSIFRSINSEVQPQKKFIIYILVSVIIGSFFINVMFYTQILILLFLVISLRKVII